MQRISNEKKKETSDLAWVLVTDGRRISTWTMSGCKPRFVQDANLLSQQVEVFKRKRLKKIVELMSFKQAFEKEKEQRQ